MNQSQKHPRQRKQVHRTAQSTSQHAVPRPTRQSTQEVSRQTFLLCCEVLEGLKPFAIRELHRRFHQSITIIQHEDPEAIYLRYTGDLHALFELKTIVAVYLVQQFAIPRPRALLGHEHFQSLTSAIRNVIHLHPEETFTGFRISAAGENSPVFQALRTQLQETLELPYNVEEGDLLLRIRPSSLVPDEWEVLIRLTPRPLSTRAWRNFHMKGALNATIAAAMIEMSKPQSTDRFLNMMCGSGTLLVERFAYGPAAVMVGVDIEVDALRGTLRNTQFGDISQHILLLATDATQLPFLEHSFNVICADLPWGQLVGTHERNNDLYPHFLQEAARVATPSAHLIILTHEIALFQRVLHDFEDVWKLEQEIKVFQGGLHPRIYVLKRNL